MAKKTTRKTRSKRSRAKKPARTPPIRSSSQALAARRRHMAKKKKGNLEGSRVYLSGPMDFVASRVEEKRNGWRNRIGQFLRPMGVTVFDPWNKPEVTGMPEYGKEDEFTSKARETWTYAMSPKGRRTRAQLCDGFFPTLHIDLRMTDLSDFLVAYCPTNVYSVGTVHEIVMATLQHKPVLFVSPPVEFPALDELRAHFDEKGDAKAQTLLEEFMVQAAVHENPGAIPSLWYMALLNSEYFFDGFGFAQYAKKFPRWKWSGLDEREKKFPPKRPLLPYLEKVNKKIPMRYDLAAGKDVENVDWLVLDAKGIQ